MRTIVKIDSRFISTIVAIIWKPAEKVAITRAAFLFSFGGKKSRQKLADALNRRERGTAENECSALEVGQKSNENLRLN